MEKMYNEAKALLGTPDHDKGVAALQQLAERGYSDAQCELGLLYYGGKGVPQDFEKAFVLFEAAANQGNALAQFRLGIMYHDGEGIPPYMDFEKAYYIAR